MQFTKQDTQCVKAIAIVAMFMHHLFFNAETFAGHAVNFAPFGQDRIIIFSLLICQVCVALFVFLSAYGITAQYNARCAAQGVKLLDKPDTVRFAGSRFGTLMLSFWFVFALSLAACAIFGRWPDGVYGQSGAFGFVLNLFGLSYLFGTPMIAGSWWYLTLAILQIFTMPLLIRWYKRDGWLVLPVALLVPKLLGVETGYAIPSYLPVAMAGIFCAEEDVFVRLRTARLCKNAAVNKLGKLVLCTAALVVLAWVRVQYRIPFAVDGPMCVAIAYFYFEFLRDAAWLRTTMAFVGKHSMNMYFVHELVYKTFLANVVYGARHFVLILLMLLCITLVLSLMIEALKKLLRYDVLTKKVLEHLCGQKKAAIM